MYTHTCIHTHTQTKGGKGMYHCGQITWCPKKLSEIWHYVQWIHTAKNSQRGSDKTYKLGKPLIQKSGQFWNGTMSNPLSCGQAEEPCAEPLVSHRPFWGFCQGWEWLSTSSRTLSLPGLMLQARAVTVSRKQASLPPQISLWWIW